LLWLFRLSGFEEFIDSILEDFDLALIFVSFALGFGEGVKGQSLTFAEEALANAVALGGAVAQPFSLAVACRVLSTAATEPARAMMSLTVFSLSPVLA